MLFRSSSMADFVKNFSSLKQFQPFPFMEMDSSLEYSMNQFPEMNTTAALENPSSGLMLCPNDTFLPQHTEQLHPYSFIDSFSSFLQAEYCSNQVLSVPLPSVSSVEEEEEKQLGGRKRKVATTVDCPSGSNSTPVLENGLEDEERPARKNCSGRGKRRRRSAKEAVEKPKEVVHVRARRGQATDSHSLAERVRRERINERMRCLQDLVPGCYKTMGMAVMLDEIINYVQSLQNQVEFLSMKLSAASSSYEISLDMDAADVPQLQPRVGNAYEGQEVDRLLQEGYGGCISFHSALPF